jgi:hypothetical protein
MISVRWRRRLTCSTACLKTASFAVDGALKPLSLRTNCSARGADLVLRSAGGIEV